MKRLSFFTFSCALLFGATVQAFDSCSRSVFVPRAQQTNAARRTDFLQHRVMPDDTCYTFWFTPGFTRSFRSCKIAQNFFSTNCLAFSGSQVVDRGEKDILADYFGLPNDFQGKACFSPTITNLFLDSSLYLNLRWLHEDVYLKLHAPFVHTRWNMRLCPTAQDEGTAAHPAGYLSRGNQELAREQLTSDLESALQGKTTFGDMQDPMRFGKIGCKQTKTELAELRAQLFWDYVKDEDRRISFSVMLSAPTGTRRTAEHLFEPIVGNGHHWELGCGFHGVWRVWESEQEDKSCSTLLNLNFSHLFRASQKRSFDFKENGRGSRYMLLSTLDKPRDDILRIPTDVSPEKQYTGHLFPAINKTTLDCKVSVGLQADMLFALSYQKDFWRFDLGYNLWVRTREKIKCRERFTDDKFAPKGDAQLYGFWDEGVYTGAVSRYFSVPLNVTQSEATIFNGQPDATGAYNANYTNPNADSAEQAFDMFGIPLEYPFGTGILNINGSDPAVLLTDGSVDECSALSPRASSSKLFAACHYVCESREQWDPYVGAGFEIEFGHSRYALSQVGLWLTLGLSY